MADTLTQAQIDELLKSMVDGKIDETGAGAAAPKKVISKYNFAQPSKFNKEHLRTLEIIFENYGRIVTSFLTGYLRTTVEVTVANSEQLNYKEFSNTLINPVILGIVDFSPLKGSVVLELSSNIGYSIIDRILGGPGLGLRRLRDFSEIETILLDRVITQLLNYLEEPWENIVRLRAKLQRIETNSQFGQIISPNDTCVLVTLNIKIGSSEGLMNFCIPHLVLEPIMNQINTKFLFVRNEEETSHESRGDLEIQLEKAVIPVSVIVGKTNIMVSDFVYLQVGDVIPLDSSITSDFDVMAGNLLKFRGKPGVYKGRNALQITSLVSKEE
ncbi:MAG: flagellar motor switch protein FliM [Clostridiales bacterium]|jgi:flagellar motor switch protein FliM|nr:flagellar motor switch protein FliM [Clostridiales bacterium]